MPDVYDDRGEKLTLGARLGRGGEGEVFEVAGQPGIVAKILHPKSRTRAKLDKVEAMLARPPAGAHDALEGLPVLTWPRTILHAKPAGQRDATFLGYTMVRIAPRDFVPFYQLTSASRRRSLGGTPITWDRLVVLAMRLCHVVRTLHRFGYAVGDLNDRNVLVSRRLTPLLMDTDSFQVPKAGRGHFPSIVGDQQYWPPELLAVDLAKHTEDREQGDRFALGVLLFQLFMGGVRPYQSRGSAVDGMESLAEKTQAGLYPWASPRRGVLEPPASAPDYQALLRPLRQAFERCFVAGHAHPRKRPTADDWYAALAKVHAIGYQTCSREARHVYAADRTACPWCADPNDPFDPSPRAARRPPPSRQAEMPSPPAMAPRPRPARGNAKGARAPAKRRTGPPQRPLTAGGATPAMPPGRAATQPHPAAPPSTANPPPRRRAKALKSAASAVTAPPAPSSGKTATAATTSRKAKDKAPRGRRAGPAPLIERWPVRGAWMGGLSLVFASPTLVLAAMPHGVEVRATMAVATILFLCAVGLAGAWRWLRGRQARAVGAWISLTVATAATLGLVGVGRWGWLLYTTGGACILLGLAAFVWLERGRHGAFRPEGVGLVHGALGVPVAYAPVIVAWGLMRL